jgi:hypothetical protein
MIFPYHNSPKKSPRKGDFPILNQMVTTARTDTNWDTKKNVWIVDLKKDNHELKHHLEVPDADTCMDNKQCVSLGLEIAQLVKNIKGEQF